MLISKVVVYLMYLIKECSSHTVLFGTVQFQLHNEMHCNIVAVAIGIPQYCLQYSVIPCIEHDVEYSMYYSSVVSCDRLSL